MAEYSRKAAAGTALLAGAIAAGSLGPFGLRRFYGQVARNPVVVFGVWRTDVHVVGHLIAFGLLGALAGLISARWAVRAAMLAAVVVFSCGIELVEQRMTPGNPLEVRDIGADSAGACAGALVAIAVR